VLGGREPDPSADRPFLYVIRHLPTGLLLFTGHVTDPIGTLPGGAWASRSRSRSIE